jgi:hypothetical protein
VLNALQEEKQDPKHRIGVNRPMARAAYYLGVCENTIRKVLFDENLPSYGEPEIRKRKSVELSQSHLDIIKPACRALVQIGSTLTTATIRSKMESIVRKEQLSPLLCCDSTLRKALKSQGFTFGTRVSQYYKKFETDPVNVVRRANYIFMYHHYAGQQRPFFFQDESWINKNITESRTWANGEAEFSRTVPQGKGLRHILQVTYENNAFIYLFLILSD